MARKPAFGRIFRRTKKRADGSRFELGPWWIEYYAHGEQQRESSKSTRYRDAEELLMQRRRELMDHKYIGNNARKTTVATLLDDLLANFRLNNRRGTPWVEIVDRHLRPFFGSLRAVEVGTAHFEKYIEQRRADGVCNGTVNRELGRLARAYSLGMECEPPKVARVPRIPKLEENLPRTGFFEHSDYVLLIRELPDYMKAPLAFGYYSGCRRGEVFKLKWSQVDMNGNVIRLSGHDTKTKKPRTFSIPPDLLQLLQIERERKETLWPDCDWVFCRHGKQIKDFRGAWEEACYRAGLIKDKDGKPKPTATYHDLRRTAVRNMIRAGVPERVAMLISGHKTRSMLDRYNIVSERDLHAAGEKLQNYIDELSREQAQKNTDKDTLSTPNKTAGADDPSARRKLLN